MKRHVIQRRKFPTQELRMAPTTFKRRECLERRNNRRTRTNFNVRKTPRSEELSVLTNVNTKNGTTDRKSIQFNTPHMNFHLLGQNVNRVASSKKNQILMTVSAMLYVWIVCFLVVMVARSAMVIDNQTMVSDTHPNNQAIREVCGYSTMFHTFTRIEL